MFCYLKNNKGGIDLSHLYIYIMILTASFIIGVYRIKN